MRSAFTVGIFVVFLLLVTTATGNLVYFVAFLLGLVLFAVPYHYKARRDELVEWFGFVGSPAQDVGNSHDKEGRREFKDHKEMKKFLSKYTDGGAEPHRPVEPSQAEASESWIDTSLYESSRSLACSD